MRLMRENCRGRGSPLPAFFCEHKKNTGRDKPLPLQSFICSLPNEYRNHTRPGLSLIGSDHEVDYQEGNSHTDADADGYLGSR